MLIGADTKELFPLKMLDRAGMKKAPLTQHSRWDRHEKALFTENTRRGWCKESSFESIC